MQGSFVEKAQIFPLALSIDWLIDRLIDRLMGLIVKTQKLTVSSCLSLLTKVSFVVINKTLKKFDEVGNDAVRCGTWQVSSLAMLFYRLLNRSCS
jgi:hypothetical protein